MMIVKRADFITSMKDYGAFATKGCPEVAFAGKSNVGKSSMINRLTNRNKLARTSATPGKTRLINVYQINDEINFIDLPGYGFAKVSKEEKLSGKMMAIILLRRRISATSFIWWISAMSRAPRIRKWVCFCGRRAFRSPSWRRRRIKSGRGARMKYQPIRRGRWFSRGR
ncbi:MAG: ribosome biogenesis GTP-binding protein YihA/YsxC [Christensenellales bacterium]